LSKSLNDIYDALKERLAEFSDIITYIQETRDPFGKLIILRIYFYDGSFLDIRWNESGKYSLHWERRHVNGTLYRYDNAKHWANVSTYPHHFHDGSQQNVRENDLPREPLKAIIHVLKFIRKKKKKRKNL